MLLKSESSESETESELLIHKKPSFFNSFCSSTSSKILWCCVGTLIVIGIVIGLCCMFL